MSWSIEGTYFESCNCDVACPCLFLSPPTTGECTALIGWHIENGTDETISLSGLNVALAVHSPGHMATTQWRVALYVDERADKAQNASLMKIFGGQGGGHPARLATHIGEIVGVRPVPIDFKQDGKTLTLKIPGITNVEIEDLTGQGDGPVTISGHPLCVAPGFPATAAKSKSLTFQDHEMAWDLTEKTAVHSPFSYGSEQ